MRNVAIASIVAAGLVYAGTAQAGVTIDVRTKTYSISGNTGDALIRAMNKRGPRHGFMARAIAQTKYSIGWQFEWSNIGSSCRMKEASGLMNMTYTYPEVTGSVPRDVAKRWRKFYAGVRVHEEKHGKIARDMIRAAERSVANISVNNDPQCRKATAEAKRRVAATYAKYENQQRLFDEREHRRSGNVHRLLLELASGR